MKGWRRRPVTGWKAGLADSHRMPWRVRQLANGSIFPVAVFCPGLGFFGHLNQTVFVLDLAEQLALRPQVSWETPQYVIPERGPDVLDYFFDRRREKKRRPVTHRIHTYRNLTDKPFIDVPLNRAKRLLDGYVSLKPDIQADVDAFCDARGIGADTLAVHYRGTDKTSEAPRVPYEDAIAGIEAVFRSGNHSNIFAASDEQEFIAALTARLGPEVVQSYDIARSKDGVAMHRKESTLDKYEAGRSAFVDGWTLARCGHIVRTTSLLSSWASILNPDIGVTRLNAPYPEHNYWPERMIEATDRGDMPRP